jgi:LysM repeat protein
MSNFTPLNHFNHCYMTIKSALTASCLATFFLYSCGTSSKFTSPPAEKVTTDNLGELGSDAPKAGEGNPYQAHLDYRSKYYTTAVAEMLRSGVPASITLAQGILESNAGLSELAQSANNHFGIKCGNDWKGKSVTKQDDDKDSNGKPVKSCFRQYDEIETCFYDHSEFLRDPRKYNRYGFLFNLPRTDYKAWARGLQTAGYATSPTYAEKLINIIDRYELHQYDRSTGLENVQAEANNRRIGKVNDAKVVIAREGESISDIAKLYQLTPEKVANYNDRGYAPSDKLKPNTRVFIQGKSSGWRGAATHHFVRSNETMFNISQLYGIQLDKLLDRNGMKKGQEPMKGEKIRLKGSKGKSEYIRLRPADAIDPADPTPTAPIINKPAFPWSMEPDEDQIILPIDPIPSGPQDTSIPTTPNTPSVGAQYHTVQAGDTLFGISRRYNTTVSKIKSLNNMTTDQIKSGQRLRVF